VPEPPAPSRAESPTASVLLFVMGLELARSGVRRANRRRKEQKEYQRLSEQYGDRPNDDRKTPQSTSDPE
jgi:uncharacterized membrane protein